jgi:predicted DNA-binding protein
MKYKPENKAVSFRLRQETKKMLEFLSLEQKRSMTEIIERLIEQEYNKNKEATP